MRTRIVFRIRQQYYDEIVAGRKTVEVRRASPYWAQRAGRVFASPSTAPPIAVFICGRRKHIRWIVRAEMATSAELVLGRPLSPQGQLDVGPGPVFAFHLGEVVTERMS